jgi:hypothetical protein
MRHAHSGRRRPSGPGGPPCGPSTPGTMRQLGWRCAGASARQTEPESAREGHVTPPNQLQPWVSHRAGGAGAISRTRDSSSPRRRGTRRSGGGPSPKHLRKARHILWANDELTASSHGQPGALSTASSKMPRAWISATPSKATTPAGSISGSTT